MLKIDGRRRGRCERIRKQENKRTEKGINRGASGFLSLHFFLFPSFSLLYGKFNVYFRH